jgi:hypothetical protein
MLAGKTERALHPSSDQQAFLSNNSVICRILSLPVGNIADFGGPGKNSVIRAGESQNKKSPGIIPGLCLIPFTYQEPSRFSTQRGK